MYKTKIHAEIKDTIPFNLDILQQMEQATANDEMPPRVAAENLLQRLLVHK